MEHNNFAFSDLRLSFKELVLVVIQNSFFLVKSLVSRASDKNTSSYFFSLHTDFITWRGLLTKIMCTPYETRESWQMAAVLHNGTIYIMEIETEENKDKRENMEERHKEMCYWGHNFESYCTSMVDKSHHNKNEEKAKESHAINDSEEFVTVIRARLNKHSLVFGAEVDCCTKVYFVLVQGFCENVSTKCMI